MWTLINQIFTSRDSQNAWAHLAGTNKWHKVLTGATDGVTNVHVLLTAAKATNRQAYVVVDGSGHITQVYV
ncbi:MAG: hypothetical protein M3442_02620 [Chloroflexota bacterium]|nr:hypothetical protein [Chloroflexota bacterium]